MHCESIGQKMGISTRLLERKILRGIKRREYHLPRRQVMHRRRAKRSHNYGVLQSRAATPAAAPCTQPYAHET